MNYDFTPEQISYIKEAQKTMMNSKKISTVERMEIANNIFKKYSMLEKDKGIFHAQLFSAMEDYLSECTK